MLNELASFLAAYPYFGTALMMVCLCLAGMVLFPSYRQAALASGLLALPWGGLWAVALVPDYWKPRLLARLGDVGPEDFLWAFATGGLAWLTAVVPGERKWSLRPELGESMRRFMIISLVGAITFVPLWLGGVRVMVAFVVSVVGLGMFLACMRRDLWRLAVWGALGFGLINGLVMKAIVAVVPDYFSQMTPGALCGVTFWDLPIEELYWAVATGAVWPLVVCFVFGARQES